MAESGQRDYDKYLLWLQQEFLPLQLATPVVTQKQIVENAIRYWNTHSAYRVETMVEYPPGTKRVQLNVQFKAVAEVYPSKTTTWINKMVHEKAAQFGELLRILREYRARLLKGIGNFNKNGVTTMSLEVIQGAMAANRIG